MSVGRVHGFAVPGRHNLLNAAAAYAAAVHGLGLEPQPVLDGLAAYGSTRRRFETKGEARGVSVVDDYAHNPGKVEAVVRTHPQHAERRRHEVHRAGRQLADLGRPSALVDAVEARFAATVAAT